MGWGWGIHVEMGWGGEEVWDVEQSEGGWGMGNGIWSARNKLKINATINNSKIFKSIQKEYGSFNNYLKTFTKDITIYEIDKATSELSDTISKDLIKRGMKFVGSTIIYSYLQAIGAIYSHDKECFMNKKF